MTTELTARIDEHLLNFPSALTDLGDNIVIIDKEHRIIFQNRLCQKIYGAKIGGKCHEEFRNQDTICPDCPSQRVFLGEGIIKTEHFYTDNNNGEQWLELIASPLTNKEGETIATIIVRRDVTEIKKKAAEKDLLIQQLYKAIDETKTLSGFLPICIFCKKIRDEQQEWSPVETFLKRHLDIEFSHGICHECGQTHYPGLKKQPAP